MQDGASSADAALEEGEEEEKGELIGSDVEDNDASRRHRGVARTSKEICCRLGKVASWASCGSCFTYLIQVGLLGTAAYCIYIRDSLYEYRRRIHSPYDLLIIYRFRTLNVDCEDYRTNGEDQADGVVDDDFFEALNVTTDVDILASILDGSEGIGDFTEDEFLINHCDGEQMQVIFNPNLREEERRDPDCVFTDRDGPQCAAGMFEYLQISDYGGVIEPARVLPAPAGYFSPEFFKCVVRCPGGAACLQSNYTNSTGVHHASHGGSYTTFHPDIKCRYFEGIDRSQQPVTVEDDESQETRYYCALFCQSLR